MSKRKTVIGIDNGTQSTKVIVYDYLDKTMLAKASAPHDLISRDDGSKEQLAEWWLQALESCFAQISPEIKETAVAIGVSGQQHGFVPINSQGEVLAPVKLWCDTSTSKECNEITELFRSHRASLPGVAVKEPTRELISQVGNPILPGYTASKILSFKKRTPELYSEMTHVLLPHDYLNYHLTGVIAMEPGDASGTGLLNIRSRRWHRELINAIDGELYNKLPPLRESNALLGTLLPEIAETYGLPAGIPVAMGSGDNMMGAIGTGSLEPDTITMSMGTSGTLFAATETPCIDDAGGIAAFCSGSGGWLPLYCTMNCTVSSEVTRNLLQVGVREIDQLAAAAEPGAGGLIMVPFFHGERSPNLPNATGTLYGMRQENLTQENLARAAMEGAVFSLKRGLDLFIELGHRPKVIRLIGGGANSAIWRQIVADICGVPVVVPLSTEAAAMGAALQALALHTGRPVEELSAEHVSIDTNKGTYPNSEVVTQYKEVYKQYSNCVDKEF